MSNHKIYSVSIPTYPGSSEIRWFLEVQTPDGRWHDVGSSVVKEEIESLVGKIEIIGNSWRQVA